MIKQLSFTNRDLVVIATGCNIGAARKVIDAAIWMSYPWADEPRNHGVVMVYGDDKEAVGKAAEKLAPEVDDRFAPPIRLKGVVTAIKKDSTNSEVVVKSGNIYTIVTEKRNAYHYERQFTDLGLNPREADILVVKIGYLVPELYEMRGDWIMALTPGGVDQDLLRLPYKRVQRPIYPLDPNMADPDLSARFIPISDEIIR
jgi:microcystin degradation protein MlrC